MESIQTYIIIGVILIIYILSSSPPKKKKSKTDISAKLHSPKELKKYNSKNNDYMFISKNIYPPIQTEKNQLCSANFNLIIGTTGTGKSTNIIYNAMMSCNEATKVVTDSGGVISADTSIWKDYFIKQGYTVKVLDLIDFKEINHFNPLWYVRATNNNNRLIKNTKVEPWERIDFDYIDSIASTIFDEKGKEMDFWNISAKSIFSFLVSVTFYMEGHQRTMQHVEELFNSMFDGDDSTPSTFSRMMDKFELELLTIQTLPNGMKTTVVEDTPRATLLAEWKRLKTQIESGGDFGDSIRGSFSVKYRFNQVNIKAITYKDDMEIDQIDQKKIIYFIRVNPMIQNYNYLNSLVFVCFFNSIMQLSKNNKNYCLNKQFLMILDEFGSSFNIPNYDGIISNLRKFFAGKGGGIYMAVQGISQLEKIYGKEAAEIIVTNSPIKTFLGGSAVDKHTKEVIADWAGETKVWNGSTSHSSKSSSTGTSESYHSLLANYINKVPKYKALVFVKNEVYEDDCLFYKNNKNYKEFIKTKGGK
jgi:type IV secretory pathway TraG/TraD family ATPase VirD4